MTDPASTALTAPRFALGDGRRRLRRGGRAGADGRVGEPAVRARRPPVVERPARRRGDRRAARLARRAGPLHRPDRRARGVRRRGRRRGLRDGGRGRDGRQQPRPGRPRTGRSASQEGYLALRILDSTDPAYVVGDARRPRPAPDARHHRLEVGHDDRAERLPRRRLGARRGGARRGPAPPLRAARRVLRGDHRPGQERSRRSPTTTTSARSSSTRPTSAAATRR